MMRPETITAIASVFIAVAALSVAVWQAILNRRHHRLSVRPHLMVQYHDHSGHPLALIVRNNGLGPAIVESITLSIATDAGRRQKIGEVFDVHKVGIEKAAICWSPEPNDILGRDMEVPLLQFEEELVVDSKERQLVIMKLQTIVFDITYMSIYGEKFELVYQVRSRKYPARPNPSINTDAAR